MPRTKNTETPVETKSVSAKVSADLYEALDAFRWENRLAMTTLVTTILNEWAEANGLLPLGESVES